MKTLILIEDENMEVFWECSECGGWSPATKAIEKDRRCRKCGTVVDELVDEINEDQEEVSDGKDD